MTLLVLAARQTGAGFHHVLLRVGGCGPQSSPVVAAGGYRAHVQIEVQNSVDADEIGAHRAGIVRY